MTTGCVNVVTDFLRKPRLVRALPSYVEKLSITLNPSIEKVEEELCQLVNEDRINRENLTVDGTSISVLERRLQVGFRYSDWHRVYTIVYQEYCVVGMCL